MINSRLLIRTARKLSRGGFTLVELLVVIGIIAILASVALGPITSGLKKAKQSSAMQSAHALYLASFSYANDHNQVYYDTTGGDASSVAIALLAGSYVSDASIFYIAGAKSTSGSSQYTGSTPLTGLKQANISWDFLGNNGNGVDSTFGDYSPILWNSTAGGGGASPATAAANNPIVATPSPNDVFGTDGLAVAFKSGASKFVVSSFTGGAYTVTMVTGANNTNGFTASSILAGK
jgi:prepilin-type N-terminal cleavage/methylation domain-containing protein